MRSKRILIKAAILLIILLLIVSAINTSSMSLLKKKNDEISEANLSESYDMIIIAPKSFKQDIDLLIDHKNNFGILTNFVSLEEIYDGECFDVTGRDNPEKIKYFIKDAYDEWLISYVLFIGGSKQVPTRLCYNDDSYENSPEPKFVSELYYADIYEEDGSFSTWDSDNDDIFGEWKSSEADDKNIDLYPEVGIGRLACQNNDEVKTMVSKIINYETQSFSDSWFKRMVVIGGDTYKKFEGYEGEIYNQQALDYMSGFSAVKLWGSTGTLDKKGWNILKEINKGCGFLYFSGHGSTETWATYDPDHDSIGEFDKNKIKLVNNQNKLPISLIGGCHNSQFSKSKIKANFLIRLLDFLPRSTDVEACWSWKLTSSSNGGCIASFGTTGLCWYGAEYDGGGTNWLHVQFFKEYSEGKDILGDIWKDAISAFNQEYPINWDTEAGGPSSLDAKTVQQWTLLGDPSLKIGGYSGTSISKIRI